MDQEWDADANAWDDLPDHEQHALWARWQEAHRASLTEEQRRAEAAVDEAWGHDAVAGWWQEWTRRSEPIVLDPGPDDAAELAPTRARARAGLKYWMDPGRRARECGTWREDHASLRERQRAYEEHFLTVLIRLASHADNRAARRLAARGKRPADSSIAGRHPVKAESRPTPPLTILTPLAPQGPPPTVRARFERRVTAAAAA